MNKVETAWTAFLDQVELHNKLQLDPIRKEALSSLNFPANKEEDWKYTNTRNIQKATWGAPAAFPQDLMRKWEMVEGHKLVFFNGNLLSEYTQLPSEVTLESDIQFKTDWRSETEVFSVLNAASKPGFRLRIAKNTEVSAPITVLFLGAGNIPVIHNIGVIAEAGSKSRVVFISDTDSEGHFNNHFSHVEVHANANLSIEKVQDTPSMEVSSDNIYVAEGAHFNINTFTLKAAWVRNNLNIHMQGENAFAGLNGVYLLHQDQHVDNHTMVDHLVPHCDSSELYKGIAADTATGVFNGKVFVRRDAQITNAFQQNANILLNDTAKINSKPELEIYADDVKCSHGSTTGQFDEEAVFYLRSRGISERSARLLLIEAFSEEVTEKISIETLGAYIVERLRSKFQMQ